MDYRDIEWFALEITEIILSFLRLYPSTVFWSICPVPVPHSTGDWCFVLKTHCIANWYENGMGAICTPFSWIVTSPHHTGVSRKCPLSFALQTTSSPQVALCSPECCAVPEDQNPAKLCSTGHSPLLESKHIPWVLSSTEDSVGSGLRLELFCQVPCQVLLGF